MNKIICYFGGAGETISKFYTVMTKLNEKFSEHIYIDYEHFVDEKQCDIDTGLASIYTYLQLQNKENRKFIFIGYSMGGLVLLALLQKYPELEAHIHKITMIDSTPPQFKSDFFQNIPERTSEKFIHYLVQYNEALASIVHLPVFKTQILPLIQRDYNILNELDWSKLYLLPEIKCDIQLLLGKKNPQYEQRKTEWKKWNANIPIVELDETHFTIMDNVDAHYLR